MTKIVLDVMGGDNSPYAMVQGAVNAVNTSSELLVFMIGPEDQINEELLQYDYPRNQIEVIHAPEVISCHETPLEAIINRKNSSMVVGYNTMKEKKADGIVSSGNSGALLVGGQLYLGKLKGVDRAFLAPIVPTVKGVSLLVDGGANMDARASDLAQFAKIGSIYMSHAMGINQPKVALVNIGVEKEKGNAVVKEAYQLLSEDKDLNFLGNIEARDFPLGEADVVVADAFVGNIILKLVEGLSNALFGIIKAGMMETPLSRVGGALVKPYLKKNLKKFDVTQHGGAPILGMKGLVVKMHGSATEKEVEHALLQVNTYREQNIQEIIQQNLVISE